MSTEKRTNPYFYMSKLSGDFEVVDQAHQLDMNYVSGHMQVVTTLPGTGENSSADTSSIDEMLEAMPNLEWIGMVVSWFATDIDIAKSKKVIFSEFGFRSIELASNTPNVYGDVMPKHSSGNVDFPMQMRAIRATLEHISEDQSITIGFCYGWDSRVSGWKRKYADGDQWSEGYWIDGKI